MTFGIPAPLVIAPAQFQASWRWTQEQGVAAFLFPTEKAFEFDRWRHLFPKLITNCICLNPRHHRRQRGCVGPLHLLQAAEMFQQPSRRTLAYAGNLQQFGGAVTHLSTLAMKRDGEAVGFIANELN